MDEPDQLDQVIARLDNVIAQMDVMKEQLAMIKEHCGTLTVLVARMLSGEDDQYDGEESE
jgi:hypothetical protein